MFGKKNGNVFQNNMTQGWEYPRSSFACSIAPIYPRDGSSDWANFRKKKIVRLIVCLCINAGKQGLLSRLPVCVVRSQTNFVVLVKCLQKYVKLKLTMYVTRPASNLERCSKLVKRVVNLIINLTTNLAGTDVYRLLPIG